MKTKSGRGKIPGFGLSLGLSLSYISFLILIPISALVFHAAKIPISEYFKIILDERVIAAFKVSFFSAIAAALLNFVFGFIIAWILARHSFFGKKIVDACIDLPFAIPTAVAGISLATVFSANGFMGKFLSFFNISLEYSRAGIVIALVFIGLPFVVRTVQPVIEELDSGVEEAAASLGANFFQIFFKVIFPSVLPALITGAAMAFARGLGEYGSVIFISSNMPYESEIVPLLIMKKLMQFDYAGASAIGATMLLIAFIMLFITNILQNYMAKERST
ncbi:sulfate ABC transporter [Fibrobacteria bacterium R8-3-H12]